ncbi:MAG TPA: glycoside hydrolase family 3 N-terminal domain-containing protein [Gemmatirosa sp.]
MSSVSQLLVPTLVADADGRFDAARPRVDAALALGVGGFLLYGGEQDAVRALTKELQQRSRTPLLLGADLERGAGQQFAGATGLPPLGALAWLDDIEALRRAARLTAREARTLGVNWNLAPVCDLDVEPDNPVLGARTLGADPARVARLAAAWIEACQAEGVLACAKHFPGHGRTRDDPHRTTATVTAPRDVLHAQDLAPFRAAFATNVASIMTAHVAYPALDPSGMPATLSREILTWLLRQQLRYDGLVVSDALDMPGVLAPAGGDEGEAAVRAVAAGCDVVLAPGDIGAVAAALDRALASHVLDPVRVQQSVRRRLRWAQWAAPPNDWRRPAAADAAWGAQLAERAVHAVRGEPVPLAAAAAVLVVDGTAADEGDPSAARGAAPPRRDDFADTLATAGVEVSGDQEAAYGSDVPLLVALFGGERVRVGCPAYDAPTLARVQDAVERARAAGRAATVVQFAPPRVAVDIGAPVLCAWSSDRAMQQAAARWLTARRAGTPVA